MTSDYCEAPKMHVKSLMDFMAGNTHKNKNHYRVRFPPGNSVELLTSFQFKLVVMCMTSMGFLKYLIELL